MKSKKKAGGRLGYRGPNRAIISHLEGTVNEAHHMLVSYLRKVNPSRDPEYIYYCTLTSHLRPLLDVCESMQHDALVFPTFHFRRVYRIF